MAKYTGGQGILESAALMSKNMYYNTCCKLLVRVWGGGIWIKITDANFNIFYAKFSS